MIDLTDIKVGARLKLQKDVIAEVIENMGDGEWVQVRCLVSPSRPEEVGAVELCHASDVVKVLSD
jgi:hypothetical protein